MKDNMTKMATMDVKRLIIKMALPAMISMVVQALYNIVDSVFVAQISEKALTALSLAFPIQMIIIAIFVGLGIGINSYMARKLGAGKKSEAENTAEHGLIIGIIIWCILAISSFFVPQLFFKLFTDDTVILNYATKYTRIIMLFSFGSIITEICMNILRATGDMMSSMKIQLLGAITNIVLDPLLIFGLFFFPELGVLGAAIATVLGQIVSMIFALVLVLKNKNGLQLNIKKFHFSTKITSEIFKVAIPAMVMQLVASIMLTGINLILAGISATSVAVFGAYFKLQSFVYMAIYGLTQGMMPVIGFNYGAENNSRVLSAIKYSAIYATIIMVFGVLLFQLIPIQLLSLFNCTEEMFNIGVKCLRIISIGFIFSGAGLIYTVFFQAIGRAKTSLIISFLRQILFLIPLALGLSKIWGLTGVWIAFPISEFLTLIIAGVVTLKLTKKLNKVDEIEVQYA